VPLLKAKDFLGSIALNCEGWVNVVLDTNICISAFQYPKGRIAVLWRAAREGRYRILVSPAIIREMANVLRGISGGRTTESGASSGG